MRVAITGFITIDTIQLPLRQVTSVGGPPCYAGLICARFGLDVTAITKVGNDFPDEQAVWLARNGIMVKASDRSVSKPTTKFRISNTSGNRSLILVNRCEDISMSQVPPGVRYDASLISPIAGEVSSALLTEISARSDFTFMDPQGFVRSFAPDGAVSTGKLRDRGILSKVDALKMDTQEAQAITGRSTPSEALEKIASLGVRKAIVTRGGESCFVLDGTRIYEITVPQAQVVDSTGAGDILSGATLGWYLKTRDFLRSACFGVAASSLSLNMIALAKVDLPMSVDESASRLFSLASPVAAV